MSKTSNPSIPPHVPPTFPSTTGQTYRLPSGIIVAGGLPVPQEPGDWSRFPSMSAHPQVMTGFGNVAFTVTNADGSLAKQVVAPNTVTNYLLGACMGWLAGTQTTSSIAPPPYIALGTSSTAATVSDINLGAEVPGTRLLDSFTNTSTTNGYTSIISRTYSTTDTSGTFTEAGLFDSPSASTTLSSNISAGATNIPVDSSTSPTVTAGQSIYFSDSTNSEYAIILTSESAGASAWTITSGTQFSHSSGITVYSFPPNLWAHVAGFSVTKTSAQILTVSWYIQFASAS